jgi:hypothetical protein
MKNTVLTMSLLVVLCITPSLLKAQPKFQAYTNARFGYSIDYPSDILIPQEEAENGDGRHFVSKDGNADLAVWGELSWDDDDSIDKRFKKDATPSEQKTVTYKLKNADWYVVSGLMEGSKIYYMKVVHRPSVGAFFTFYFVYPKSQETVYNPLISRITSSFK